MIDRSWSEWLQRRAIIDAIVKHRQAPPGSPERNSIRRLRSTPAERIE